MSEGAKLFGDEHVRRYRETGGEVGHTWKKDSKILLLTTKGRKTGEPRVFVNLELGRSMPTNCAGKRTMSVRRAHRLSVRVRMGKTEVQISSASRRCWRT